MRHASTRSADPGGRHRRSVCLVCRRSPTIRVSADRVTVLPRRLERRSNRIARREIAGAGLDPGHALGRVAVRCRGRPQTRVEIGQTGRSRRSSSGRTGCREIGGTGFLDDDPGRSSARPARAGGRGRYLAGERLADAAAGGAAGARERGCTAMTRMSSPRRNTATG